MLLLVDQQKTDQTLISNNTLVKLGDTTELSLSCPGKYWCTRRGEVIHGQRPATTNVTSSNLQSTTPPPYQAPAAWIGKRFLRPRAHDQNRRRLHHSRRWALRRLEMTSNTYSGKQTYPLDKQVINIGRDASNDIVIDDMCVSKQHAQIVREGNRLIFVHPHPSRPQTANGLLYQGRKIRGDEVFRKPLNQGDIFRIVNENGSFVTLTFNDGSGIQEDEIPPVHPIKLEGNELTIGRLPDNTVVLAHPQVSATSCKAGTRRWQLSYSGSA